MKPTTPKNTSNRRWYCGKPGAIIDTDCNERGTAIYFQLDQEKHLNKILTFTSEEADRDLAPWNAMCKTVEWSYPTSPNAVALGRKDGCWTVEIIYRQEPPRVLAGFKTRPEALEYARNLATIEWHPLFLKFHPEDAGCTCQNAAQGFVRNDCPFHG
jgi:hypothetical protein